MCKSVKTRCERIFSIRLKIIVHTRLAEYNRNHKGINHFDTKHELEIIEELSARLSKELKFKEIEISEEIEAKQNSWDIVTIDNIYDV